MEALGLIPARGGSKGIPRKNITPVGGKPLLAYTCEVARASASLTRLILSTDDEEIAAVGRAWGVEVPFLRPAELSRDDTPSIDVALHALTWIQREEGWTPDAVVLLQPTSPMRTVEHLDAALELFQTAVADTVVSVMTVPHRFSPYSIMRLTDGTLEEFWAEPLGVDRFRRQDLPTLYARNGPAILITRTPVLVNRRSFYGDRVIPFIMSEADSVDIDTQLDLQVAEIFLRLRGV